jgi:hypothetical protein
MRGPSDRPKRELRKRELRKRESEILSPRSRRTPLANYGNANHGNTKSQFWTPGTAGTRTKETRSTETRNWKCGARLTGQNANYGNANYGNAKSKSWTPGTGGPPPGELRKREPRKHEIAILDPRHRRNSN